MDEVGLLDDAVVALLDGAPTPVVATTPEGVIGYVNPRAAEAFGYTREELVGVAVEVLVPPETATGHVRLRTAYAAAPEVRTAAQGRELMARRRDGSQFPTEISLMPLEVDGRSWVVATVHDLSYRADAERRLRSSNRAYLTLARTNQAIVRARDAASLYRELCRVAVVQGDYLGAWVGVPEDGHVRRVATAGALEDYIAALDIVTDPGDPRGRGPTALALREGRPYFSHDFRSDSTTGPWHALAAPFGIAASATLPLRCAGEVVAVVTIYSQQAHVFDDQVRELLVGMAENVSFALDGFDATRRLAEVAQERTRLAERLIAAQEEERDRIAADLHDESVQSLAALDLRLGLLSRRVSEAAPALAADLAQVRTGVGEVARQLRDLLFELETPPGDQSPEQLVREVAEHVLDGAGVRWDVHAEPDQVTRPGEPAVALTPEVRSQVVRIVKEALFNVRKHARAEQVTVTLSPTRGGLGVTVVDDGVGFDPGSAAAPGHRGLKNLADRAAVAGGWLRVEPGDPGTRVRFWVPAPRPGS